MIEVINISKTKDFGTRYGDVYIGRAFGKWQASIWQNLYPIRVGQDRDKVLQLYEEDLHKKLRSGDFSIESLRVAKRLGCWCKPLPCHGDILKRLIEESLKC